jgi:hypothetical protein
MKYINKECNIIVPSNVKTIKDFDFSNIEISINEAQENNKVTEEKKLFTYNDELSIFFDENLNKVQEKYITGNKFRDKK